MYCVKIVGGNYYFGENIRRFADALKENKTLQYICLGTVHSFNDSGSAILAALKTTSTILHFSFDWDRFSYNPNEFADTLSANKSLIILDLSYARISEEGAREISIGMNESRTLRKLILCSVKEHSSFQQVWRRGDGTYSQSFGEQLHAGNALLRAECDWKQRTEGAFCCFEKECDFEFTWAGYCWEYV
eukprot:TRINITY_DN5641_c0_g4_i4.p1 TRINITY_DN5641_c0_g4~~TRINITY_DN5641_c0_g4_i4.p1  ORF type:complete len:189 (+),score=4.16 TRINITY_DN5641_c0_g4_i4:104-670(+)